MGKGRVILTWCIVNTGLKNAVCCFWIASLLRDVGFGD